MTPFGRINDHMIRAEFLRKQLKATSALRDASAGASEIVAEPRPLVEAGGTRNGDHNYSGYIQLDILFN